MSSPISILLADDHVLVCEALKSRIELEPDMRVVAMAPNADQAASEAIRLNPDIVLMDISMPGLVPFEAVKIIRIHSPETKIIFLSALSHDRCIEEALSSGAAGYLSKADTPQSVVQGIRTVAAGGVCFSPEIQSRLAPGPGQTAAASKGPTRMSTLSRRELEVLQYLARGMSKKEIAHTVHISVKTVERHTDRLMAKLDIHDRVELARFAIREGLAEP